MKQFIGVLTLLSFLTTVLLAQTDTVSDYVPNRRSVETRKNVSGLKEHKPERLFRTVHKTNPFCLLVGGTPYNSELRYMNETVLAPQLSLVLSASYLFKGPVLRSIERLDTIYRNSNGTVFSLNGFRVQAGLRFYPIRRIRAPRGFWFGPHFSYLDYKIKAKNSNSSNYIGVTHFNINLLLGYQFIAGRVCFDLYAGLGYKNNIWITSDASGKHTMKEIYERYPFYAMPLKLNFGANFGVAF
jgi:hypothetical protein